MKTAKNSVFVLIEIRTEHLLNISTSADNYRYAYSLVVAMLVDFYRRFEAKCRLCFHGSRPTLMLEAERFSENIFQATRRHSPEGSNFYVYRRWNLNSRYVVLRIMTTGDGIGYRLCSMPIIGSGRVEHLGSATVC
jgi:hypothetical protein